MKVSDIRAAAAVAGGPGRWSLNDLQMGRVPDNERADVYALLDEVNGLWARRSVQQVRAQLRQLDDGGDEG